MLNVKQLIADHFGRPVQLAEVSTRKGWPLSAETVYQWQHRRTMSTLWLLRLSYLAKAQPRGRSIRFQDYMDEPAPGYQDLLK